MYKETKAPPQLPEYDSETGEPFELSQTFKDVPDSMPIKIDICYTEGLDHL